MLEERIQCGLEFFLGKKLNEHSQRLLSLIQKVPQNKNDIPLAVPLSIRVLRKCVSRGVDSLLIKHLHFYDLQCLLMQFDIADIESYLEREGKDKLRRRGIAEVREISGAEAVKFLRG